MRVRHSVLSISVVCLSLIFSACANLSTVDKPLSQWRPEMGKDFLKQAAGERSGEILVLVSFSGGGTRAAAFAYGTLKALSATRIMTENGETSLLHEIDAISSVSGGSFTSAYYGIRGDRIFDEFESRFLRKNVEGALIGSLFNPLNWPRLMSFEYGRADMAADYYDRTVFEGATFADLQRPGGPLVIINATDLALAMGIGDKLKRRATELSQGEKQRAAICRALLPQPKLILADEATGNLDPENKSKILDLLFAAADEHDTTLLAVTHDHELLGRFNRVIDFSNFQPDVKV